MSVITQTLEGLLKVLKLVYIVSWRHLPVVAKLRKFMTLEFKIFTRT